MEPIDVHIRLIQERSARNFGGKQLQLIFTVYVRITECINKTIINICQVLQFVAKPLLLARTMDKLIQSFHLILQVPGHDPVAFEFRDHRFQLFNEPLFFHRFLKHPPIRCPLFDDFPQHHLDPGRGDEFLRAAACFLKNAPSQTGEAEHLGTYRSFHSLPF